MPIQVIGSLTADQCQFTTLTLIGQGLLNQTRVDHAFVTGALQAKDAHFTQTISILGHDFQCYHCRINYLTIASDATHTPVVRLYRDSIVSGQIRFSQLPGQVHLYASKLSYPPINGQIIFH